MAELIRFLIQKHTQIATVTEPQVEDAGILQNPRILL